MEAVTTRRVKSGAAYDRLFEKTLGEDMVVRKSATLDDTMLLIPKVVRKTLNQSYKIAHALKRPESLEDTLQNIWQWTYDHIAYKRDEKGTEQIRSPRRTWRDRFSGVDCDCYSTFISSILTNLGITHVLRITKYSQNHFQHIYPIVPIGQNKYITMDCVTDQFNYEVPFSEKRDYPMELQFLNGLDGVEEINGPDYVEGFEDGVGELGRAKRKKKQEEPQDPNQPVQAKKKKFFGKLLKVVNKLNPAAVLLRNGLLACMKLNIMNVARRMRWSYASQSEIQRLGGDVATWQKLVKSRQKLESIFTSAGGSASNLKKAMLNHNKPNPGRKIGHDGKVNQTTKLTNFNGLEGNEPIHIGMNLPELLGPELYYAENIAGMEEFQGYQQFDGFGELGEPVTAASVSAAMGVVAAIAANLKKIGDLFKGQGGENSADFDEKLAESSDNNPQKSSGGSPASSAASEDNGQAADAGSRRKVSFASESGDDATSSNTDAGEGNSAMVAKADATSLPAMVTPEPNLPVNINPFTTAVNTASNTSTSSSTDTKQTFWQKHKWAKPAAYITGGVAVIGLGWLAFHKRKPHPTLPPSGLSGTSNIKRKKKKKPAKEFVF